MGKKEQVKITAPPVFVGASDLNDGSKKVQAIIDRLGIEFILINVWGFDKNVDYEGTGNFYSCEEKTFRNRSGKVVTEKRYAGTERLDDEWMEQGRPSDEAKIAVRNDISYVRELQSLGRQMKSC